MKQTLSTKKNSSIIKQNIAGFSNKNVSWDSPETKNTFYTEEINKFKEMVNSLSIMGNAKQIIYLCSKIKVLKGELSR